MPNQVQVFMKRVLGFGLIAIAVISLVGGSLGFLVAGISGVWAALVGALAAFVFMSLTVLSIFFGAKLDMAAMMGIVLGGWLVKMAIFVSLFIYLQGADWLTGSARPVLFITVVLAVITGLILDVWLMSKARFAPDVELP